MLRYTPVPRTFAVLLYFCTVVPCCLPVAYGAREYIVRTVLYGAGLYFMDFVPCTLLYVRVRSVWGHWGLLHTLLNYTALPARKYSVWNVLRRTSVPLYYSQYTVLPVLCYTPCAVLPYSSACTPVPVITPLRVLSDVGEQAGGRGGGGGGGGMLRLQYGTSTSVLGYTVRWKFSLCCNVRKTSDRWGYSHLSSDIVECEGTGSELIPN